MEIIRFEVGDILKMKKKHPCGSFEMKIVRTGSDVRIICLGCGRDMTVSRIKLEKNIKNVLPAKNGENVQNS